jgi:hypothetical protein
MTAPPNGALGGDGGADLTGRSRIRGAIFGNRRKV